MSDRVTVCKPTEELDRLRMWTDDAAAELTRLRADLAAAQERAGRIKTAAQELIKAVDATADHASWLKHIAALRTALGEPQ